MSEHLHPERRPLEALLLEAEQALDTSQGFASGVGDSATRDAELAASNLAVLMEELDGRVTRHPAEAARFATRLDRVRAAHALQMREIPGRALDGLYDDIRRSLSGETAWLRAGMSESFLDAPRTLLLWRRVAVAACLLLAAGTGYHLRDSVTDTDTRSRVLGFLPASGIGADDRADRAPATGRGGATGSAAARAGEHPAGHWAPASARPVSFGDVRAPRVGVVQRYSPQPSPQASPQASPRRGGIYVFGAQSGAEDARRMLDRVQIFPVPGREFDEGEEN